MKVVTKKFKEEEKVKVGDVIETDKQFYLVVERTMDGSIKTVFELRNLEGGSTRNGKADSIEDLIQHVKDYQGSYRHYPASKYQIVLKEID